MTTRAEREQAKGRAHINCWIDAKLYRAIKRLATREYRGSMTMAIERLLRVAKKEP